MASAGGNWKALYEAAKQGDLEELKYWLADGTDPNVQHVEVGSTPLIVAAENGHLEVVKALVLGGADPSIRSHWDRCTAFETASDRGQRHVAEWLSANATKSSGSGPEQRSE